MDDFGARLAPVVRAYPRGHIVAPHSHPWPQLLYASSGVVGVAADGGTWIVPPEQGLWLPQDCAHETWTLTDVRLNSLYLSPRAAWRRDCCKLIAISPLLRELVLAVEGRAHGGASRRDRLVGRLLAAELAAAPAAASPIPMPTDERLLRLCRRFLKTPSLDLTLDRLAAEAGGSSRTFARLFVRDLGMSFRDWRKLVLFAHATAYLSRGAAAKATASLLGYTPSGFSVMLKGWSHGAASPANPRDA